MMITDGHTDVREYLVKELKRDLVGPRAANEELDEGPISRYMAGILFPPDTSIEAEEDQDGGDAPEGEDDDVDIGTLMAAAMNPSSMGMTFTVPLGESIRVTAKAAVYVKSRDIVKNNQDIWTRMALNLPATVLTINSPNSNSEPLERGLELHYRVRVRDEKAIVTLSLVNRLTMAKKDERLDGHSFFQPEIRVEAAETGKAIFLPRTNDREAKQDDDRKLNALLYRHVPEFAVGHGCATNWAANGERASEIWTEFIPAYEIPQVSPDPAQPYAAQRMKFLAEGQMEPVVTELGRFLEDYRAWIKAQDPDTVPETLREVAGQNLKACQQAAERIQIGINLLANDAEVFQAFQLANRAMLIQRARSTWLKEVLDGRTPGPIEDDQHQWRPFQLAFILLSLTGIVDPQHESRGVVDLLWFPTGGGKTEAYLGLTAFTIFLRRLRKGGQKEAAGVTVLMRYTLRLLTIQQFQRAASLIVACEYLRRKLPARLGQDPISLGLWVGGAATPNSLKDANQALNKLKNNEDPYGGNPYQVQACPWCGSELTPNNYYVGEKMSIRCPNTTCEYKTGLPLYLVDDDIYSQRPSLLIGTVDKFARLPWVDRSGAIFGAGKTLPPELIIQDELHLISGPLGSMVGLYETAVDLLSECDGVYPKVIASTATIRRASEQSKNLFNRDFRQFPPPGIDARDNFFSVQVPEEQKPGRLYVGIHAPGKSIKTALLRICAVLLQRISEHPAEDRLRDPYWTLVAYFNSLRELGGALRLVEDDIRDRMKLLARWNEEKVRYIRDPRELNSRCASKEIPELLKILESPKGNARALDVLLSTNMISVGVDIDRLGLMVMNGQPKTTSEYIQATSRVGRKYPGLVVTLYNWTRPRDRSHFERFKGYHSSIYSQVEPTSVTPFSSRARQRGLHGVFITLVRHLLEGMSAEDAAIQFDAGDPRVAAIIEKILARVEAIDETEAYSAREEMQVILERWSGLANSSSSLLYGEPHQNDGKPFLMVAAEKGAQADLLVFPTLNSLRDVEGESELYILKEKKNNG